MNNKTQGETEEQIIAEEIKKEKIRRAMLASPTCITSEATVAEMDKNGQLTVLDAGTHEWVCVPGEQNIIGGAPASWSYVRVPGQFRYGARKPVSAASTSSGASSRQ